MKKALFTSAFLLVVAVAFAGSDPMLKSTVAKALNLNEVASSIEYPAESNENGVEGTVLMKLSIDAEGNVSNKSAVSYPCSKLKDAVELAVKDLKFEPARNAFGQSVASTVKIPFAFELSID